MTAYAAMLGTPVLPTDQPCGMVTIMICDACGKIAEGDSKNMPSGWFRLVHAPIEACSVACFDDLNKNPREFPRDPGNDKSDEIVLVLARLKRKAGDAAARPVRLDDKQKWRCVVCKATGELATMEKFERDHAHEEAFK